LIRPSPKSMGIDPLFDTLIAENLPYLRNQAIKLCNGNRDDAEDLISETMIDAYRGFHSYRGVGFCRWLFHMMNTNRIDMIRRARVRKTESLESIFWEEAGQASTEREIADFHYAPETVFFQHTYSESLERALANLPETFKAPLLLCDVEEMEYEEIATMLSIPVGTVRSRIHRARHRMRAMLPESCPS
jgi:RNA polymerase sigma-70 factor, ECF subfamily